MKLRMIALFFGLAFIVSSVAWYIPALNDENGLLFGLFDVDSMHNTIHFVTGVIGLLATSSSRISKLYLTTLGIIYALFGLLGIIITHLHMSTANNILHVIIGGAAFIIGTKVKVSDTL